VAREPPKGVLLDEGGARVELLVELLVGLVDVRRGVNDKRSISFPSTLPSPQSTAAFSAAYSAARPSSLSASAITVGLMTFLASSGKSSAASKPARTLADPLALPDVFVAASHASLSMMHMCSFLIATPVSCMRARAARKAALRARKKARSRGRVAWVVC
jgi:hypothetical protein